MKTDPFAGRLLHKNAVIELCLKTLTWCYAKPYRLERFAHLMGATPKIFRTGRKSQIGLTACKGFFAL